MTWKQLLGPVTIAFAFNACCPKPPVTRLETKYVGCLPDPPPEPEDIVLAGPEQGCPEKYELCVDAINAARLERYLRQVNRWMQQAAISCKVSP